MLGFTLVSILFSFFVPASAASHVSNTLNGGRPALAFIGAQLFNILWTLLWAYLLFNGQFFPVPALK